MNTIYAIIADDLTGAGDTGAQFSKAGLATRVLFGDWSSQDIQGADILVVNTDSRFLPGQDAARRVSAAAEALKKAGAVPFFKKVDSTLRGPIGAEIDALMNTLSLRAALVCPIFPANGRTLAGGYLLVEGQPVSRSAAGKDPVTPVKISHIPTLLAQQSTRPILSCTLDELSMEGLTAILSKAKVDGAIVVCDAVSNADLELIAQVAMANTEGLLLVGAAGLANPVAKILAARANKKTGDDKKRRPVIVAVGSVNPTAREQVKYLLASGESELVTLEIGPLLGSEANNYLASAVEECVNAARRGLVPVIASAGERQDVEEALVLGKKFGLNRTDVAAKIASSLGQAVRSFVETIPEASIVATGGDVARAILARFECGALDILDEVSPGIPVCALRGGQRPGTRIVTKAGGFGKNESLKMAVDFLSAL